MNESLETRPSKKQRELLIYIDAFITGHGYGPSYREIMRALNYKSVSTVAIHVDNLIKKGHLRKRDKSARSLEVIRGASKFNQHIAITADQQKWLVEVIGSKFAAAEASATLSQSQIDNLYVLVGALQVLGLADAARSFKPRLLGLRPTKQ